MDSNFPRAGLSLIQLCILQNPRWALHLGRTYIYLLFEETIFAGVSTVIQNMHMKSPTLLSTGQEVLDLTNGGFYL